MALVLIENPPSVLADSTDWTKFLTRENGSNLGTGLSIPTFTLNFWDASTTKPTIAEGSIIEVGGSLYQADADTALTDDVGIANGTVHIKLVPQAGTPPASVVPTLTNDVIPAWDANKAGWYDSNDKFLPFEMEKASAVYTEKSEYVDQFKEIKTSSTGVAIIPTAEIETNNVETQNMTGTMKWKYYYKNLSTVEGALFTELATKVPNIGDVMICHGTFQTNMAFRFVRQSATEISLSTVTTSGVGNFGVSSGGATNLGRVEIMSNFDVL